LEQIHRSYEKERLHAMFTCRKTAKFKKIFHSPIFVDKQIDLFVLKFVKNSPFTECHKKQNHRALYKTVNLNFASFVFQGMQIEFLHKLLDP